MSTCKERLQTRWMHMLCWTLLNEGVCELLQLRELSKWQPSCNGCMRRVQLVLHTA